MVTSNSHLNGRNNKKNGSNNHKKRLDPYNRLASMGKVSVGIINKLYNPIDAVNRFLNLALQNIDEDSQNRQFLLESKSGLRRMSSLLKRLNSYAKKMEKEMGRVLKLEGLEGDK